MKAAAPTSSRKMTARTSCNIEAVRTSVGWSPKQSIRRRSQELEISHASVQRILNVDLHLYPYRIQIKHKLTPGDKIKSVAMCQWFQDKIVLNPNFLNDIWFSVEAHFLLSGQVNRKNSIFWGTAAPNEVLQRPFHSKKCTAWVAMTKHDIIGTFWFEDENGEPLTATKGVVRWGPTAVLDYPWLSKSWELQDRLPLVLVGRGYSPYSQCDPWVAGSMLSPKNGQSAPRSRLVLLFTRLEPIRYLFMGLFEGPCIWEQP